MRLIALIAILTLMPAMAQETACSEMDACPIPLDVDVDSLDFGGESSITVTAGDWFYFDTFNLDDAAHEISIAGLGINFVATTLESEHGPYLLDAPGSYEVVDIETGRTATLHVVEDDVSKQGGEPAATKDSPALPAALVLLALIGLVAARR